MENIKKILPAFSVFLVSFVFVLAGLALFNEYQKNYTFSERILEKNSALTNWTATEELYGSDPAIRSFFNSEAGIVARESTENKSTLMIGVGTRFGSYVLTARHILSDSRLITSGETELLHFFLYEGTAQRRYAALRAYEDLEMDFALLKIVGSPPETDSSALVGDVDYNKFNNLFFFRAHYLQYMRPLYLRMGIGFAYDGLIYQNNKIASFDASPPSMLTSVGSQFKLNLSPQNSFLLEGDPYVLTNGSSGSPVIVLGADGRVFIIGMIIIAETEETLEGSHSGALGVAYKINSIIERIKKSTGIDLLNGNRVGN